MPTLAAYMRSTIKIVTKNRLAKIVEFHPSFFTVNLRIFGDSINPSQICEILDMKAEWWHKAGDPRIDSKGERVGVYDHGYCSINIQHVDSIELADFIDKQAKFLLKHKKLFLDIKHGNGRVEFFIGWFGDGNFGDVFQSST